MRNNKIVYRDDLNEKKGNDKDQIIYILYDVNLLQSNQLI